MAQKPLPIVALLRAGRRQYLSHDPRGRWTLSDLAHELYAIPALQSPTRTQREAVRRAVRRLEAAGAVEVEHARRWRAGRPALVVKLPAAVGPI